MIPKITEERKLWKQGYRFVACVDEAGRGPLAGPVVAAAVCIINPKHEARSTKQYQNSNFQNLKRVSNFVFRASNLKLRDSKKLTPRAREKFYEIFTIHSSIQWGIGIVSEKVIDKINIFQATKLAMRKAVFELEKKLKTAHVPKNSHNTNLCYSKGLYYADFLIVDGNMKLENISIPQKAIVKGDEKVFSCALASIIAKITRDKIMLAYHKQYPQYGFDRHKGYGTPLHFAMLKKYGSCAIHRKSFQPVAAMLKSEIRISKFETNPKFKSSKF